MKSILDFVCCPKCGSDLKFSEDGEPLLCKSCGKEFPLLEGHLLITEQDFSDDVSLSRDKWDIYYGENYLEKNKEEEREYLNLHFDDVLRQIEEYKPTKNIVYLEIGCGPMFLGQNIARDCDLVIGVDFSASALKVAQKMFAARGIKNYLLIQASIEKMPLKDNCVDLVYGGGVIEHLKETQKCVGELYRVLKKGGVSFNTVPYLNLGALTYRQIWGHIPNFPGLKQMAEFIHIKLLGGGHMTFGYDSSFLGSTLKKIHQRAGFGRVVVKKFEVRLLFDFAPKKLRPFFAKLANSSRLFWPMVKVVGEK